MAAVSWGEFADRFLMPLDDPGSRLFHLNIVIALALVALWVFMSLPGGERAGGFKKLVFRKRYWWNRSTKIDYQVYLLNGVLKVLLLIPLLDWSFHVSRFVAQGLERWHGDFLGLKAGTPAILAFTVASFVWDDFLRFTQHVLMHKVPWLWRIHAMHHSARILTPVTLFRNHPLESAIAVVRNSLSLGVSTGMFIFLFESRFTVLTLFGVNLFGFLFNLLGANLRHSHIPVSFGPWLERVFISPKQHQIHHSRAREHRDRNFGVSLSLWDALLGSLVLSRGTGRLSFGIGGRGHRRIGRELALSRIETRV